MQGKRSAALCYGLTLLSSGLFIPYWIYLLMSDVNELRGHGAFNATRWAQWLYGLWAANLLLVFTSDVTGDLMFGPFITALAIALLLVSIVAIARIGVEVRALHGDGSLWPAALGTVLLTSLFYVSLPVLQLRINRLRA